MSLGEYTVELPDKDMKLERINEFRHTFLGKKYSEHDKYYAVDTFKGTSSGFDEKS